MIPSNGENSPRATVAEKVIETAVDSIISIDESGAILSYNPAAERILGYSSQEIIGRNVRCLIPPPFQNEHDTYVSNYLTTGNAKVIGIGREVVVLRKDGTEFPADISVSEIEHGGTRIFTAVLRDLTEVKRREDELFRSSQKAHQLATFGKILDRSLNEFYIFSCETLRFVHINRGAQKNLGYSMEELRKLTPLDIKPKFTPSTFAALVKPLLDKTEANIEFTTVHRRKDGSEYPVQIYLETSIFGNDSVFVATILDITERMQWEAQVQNTQKLESLGVLAGGIAHDFNNLLMGVLGHSSLILKELPANSPIQSSILDIQNAAIGASELCKQMLAYSGKGRFVVQPLSLSEVVKQFGHLLEVSIPKNVILKYELQDNVPAIQADTRQMQQLVMNLITNAAEAVGDKSGIVTLATGVMTVDTEYLKSTYLDDELPSGDYVYYEVSDTGCGMTKDVMRNLFDPFFSTKFTGRGLGLAALLGIVRGHHGAVKVYSEVGKGTTFKVLFPAIDMQAISINGDTPPPKEWKAEGTVLVVDDDETARTVSKRILESGGFSTLVACDGLDALDVFEKHQSEIVGVLLDMTMPRMDGVKTFQRLKQIDSDVTVILTSGYNEQEATSRFAGKGLAGFIQKPYQSDALLQLMHQMLSDDPEDGGTPPNQSDSGSTILVVDDQDIVRNASSTMLASEGFHVLTASTGEEALDIYRSNANQIELVILDRNLKGMSGEKVLSQMKIINPQAKVALCSGSDLNIAMSGNQLGGATAIIPKSLDAKDFLKTVQFLLDRKPSDSD